jgi:solute carrier family 35 protein F5
MIRTQLGGALLIVSVAGLWVASSEITQKFFYENSFSKPVFLSYLSQSLFSLFLLQEFVGSFSSRAEGSTQTLGQQADEAEIFGEKPSIGSARISVSNGDHSQLSSSGASQRQLFATNLRASTVVAPIWFLSNLLYNVSLTYTSVSSSSIISSLSCVFVLIFGTLLGVEGFHRYSVIAVALNLVGMGLVSWSDASSSGDRTVLGDVLSLTAASLYALQTVLIKKLFASQSERSVSRFLGYLGGFCLVLGWPLIVVCHVTKIERVQVPSSRIFLLILVNGFIGGVFSDYLWALAICYTSALAASLALSLTIPFSVLADVVLKHSTYSPIYLFGALLVISGFVLANIEVPNN